MLSENAGVAVTACILVGAAPVRGLGRGVEVLLRLGLPYILLVADWVSAGCASLPYLPAAGSRNSRATSQITR